MGSKWSRSRQWIQVDKLLWSVATCCAFLLLLAPLTPSTSWVNSGVEIRGNASAITEGKAWALVVGGAGVTAIICLVIGAFTRQKVIFPSFSAALATGALGIAALSSGYSWSDLATRARSLPEFTQLTAGWSNYFAIIALIAFASSIGLTCIWLEPAQDDW